MKLVDPLKQYPPFDVPTGLAQSLLAQGYTEVKTTTPEKPKHPMKWFVREGARVEDYQGAPVLWHSCPNCGIKGTTESLHGTAHKTTKLFHCGQRGEVCPPDVAREYEIAYAAWAARSRRPAPPAKKLAPPTTGLGFDPRNPNHVLPLDDRVKAELGIKTRQELIAEAVAATK